MGAPQNSKVKSANVYLGVDDEGNILRQGANGGVRKLSANPKQIRARARRAGQIQAQELAHLHKPLEEWDDEELARGFPRSTRGNFSSYAPEYISREVHEEIVNRFRAVVRRGLNVATVPALGVLLEALENRGKDSKGRPVVPWSVKVDVAKFLVEHVVGKPKQVVEADISVKLQAVLAQALVVPGQNGIQLLAQGFAEAATTPWSADGDEEDVFNSIPTTVSRHDDVSASFDDVSDNFDEEDD